MKATLEPVAYVLRFHSDADAVLGDPYESSATVTVDDNGVATMRGMSWHKPFTIAAWKATKLAFRRVGIKEILYTRRTPLGVRTFRVTTEERAG